MDNARMQAMANPGDPSAGLGDAPRRRIDCELMNDLNVIIGFAEILAGSSRLDDPQRRYATHIVSSGSRACATLKSLFEKNRAIALGEPQHTPAGPSPTHRHRGPPVA
jgi:hypothetical protein